MTGALRHLLAWLWAAVWLDWRLLGVRWQRVFGRRVAVVTGVAPDYHLNDDEVPVEGVDYDPAELPPDLAAMLETTRAELLGHARDVTARRVRRQRVRRRRAASLAMAALLTLAVLGAGASALVTGSTGVPEVDRLLGISQEKRNERMGSLPMGPGSEDRRPAVSAESTSIEVGLSDGTPAMNTFYVSEDGSLCVAVVVGDRGGAVGGVTCKGPAYLRRRIARDGGVILDTRGYRDMVLNGVVDSRITRLEAEERPLKVALGSPWTVPGVGTLRPFVATGEGDPRMMAPFVVEAVSGDGTRAVVRTSRSP